MTFSIILVIIFLAALPATNKDAKKASHKIAFLEDVNGDGLSDIIITDGTGYEVFILFGQSDGSFKNLEKILDDFSQFSKEESDKIREKYKRR